jgi:hypothetical protein
MGGPCQTFAKKRSAMHAKRVRERSTFWLPDVP